MRLGGILVLCLASCLGVAPVRAGTTARDFTGVAITPVAYAPSEKVTYGQFTLRNDRPKSIIFVQVRCTVVGDAGQTSEATATVNDVATGTTVKSDIYFVREPKNVKGDMRCVPFDMFEAD